MPTYIAFLRAINVGGHTVKMERLRELFEELNFSKVETFIASGNVIFRSPETDVSALERKIEAHLKAALGYEVATFIRSARELEAITSYEPFPGADIEESGYSLYIIFMGAEPGEESKQKLHALSSETDELHVHGRELYWLCRIRFSETSISQAMIDRATGKMPGTNRNMTTVRKLAAKYPHIEE